MSRKRRAALDGEILVKKSRRLRGVREDAAHARRREQHDIDTGIMKKRIDRMLIREIELGVRAGDDVLVAVRIELAYERGADHAAMAGHIDACLLVHGFHLLTRGARVP